MENKVALVTGGARGIGREIVNRFAGEGADIAVCDINQEALDEVKKEVESMGRKCLTFASDVTKAVEVDSMVSNILDNFKKVDILINNAGITRDGLLVRMSEKDWDSVLDINLKGVFNCTKAVAKPMMKQRWGRIINIASIIGIMGNAGQANYAASKGGIIAFTKSVAKELASRNINVNAIAPGFIQTDMTKKLPDNHKEVMLKMIPLNRFGEARDVANTAIFLASESAGYITGHVIQVDGGMVM
ncbi:MAG: 3-oxoacyl-[acyl-carrier-protein] reductase [Candidatus Omnitrophota bacterium]